MEATQTSTSGSFTSGATITAGTSISASTSIAAGTLISASTSITAGTTVSGTQLISSIATGTAPLTVTSTTQVTNLNSSFLQGYSPVVSTSAGTANSIVLRNGSGDDFRRYGFASYFNSTDDISTGAITHIMAKFGDNYHRSATAAKVAAFLSGQTLNVTVPAPNFNDLANKASGTGNYVTTGQFQASSFTIKADTNNRFQQGALILRNDSPTIYLQDTDHNSAMLHCNSNLFYVLRGGNDTTAATEINGVWPLYINLTNNNAVFGGTVSASSDVRFKKNINTIQDSLNKVLNLRGVTFEKIETEGTHMGVIAQEIEKIIPEVVSEDKDGKKSVAYGNIVGLLIEAIKEQQIQINELKDMIALNNK